MPQIFIGIVRSSFLAAACFFGVTSGVVFCQNITMSSDDWSRSGIEVVPASSPAFADLVGPALSPQASPKIQAFFPFSFILRNKTSHTIIAYSSKWRCVDHSGTVKQRGNLHVNLSTLGPPDSIAPGRDRLVTPVLGLGYQPGPDPDTLASLEAKVLPLYTTQQSVTISLDAIIFDDGTLVGPDAYSAGIRIQAFADAVRDLNTGLLAAINQGSTPGSISSYLNAMTAKTAASGAPTTSSTVYQRHYRTWQRNRAALYSRILAEQGPDVLATAVRKQPTPTLPAIHR